MHELDDKVALQKVVASVKRQLNAADIQTIGIGNEFHVLQARVEKGLVVVKVPKDRIFSNVNDAHIEARVLLEQELAIMQHLKAHGLQQVPEPIRMLEAAGFPALAMSFVPSDDSEPDDYTLGKLLAAVHDIESPWITLSAQEGRQIPELIAARLHRRWAELHAFVVDLQALPAEDWLVRAMDPIRSAEQLLHMDFRKANFRMRGGEVVALFDWSNALLGHPALELARVAETGETSAAFIEGYAAVHKISEVDPHIETIFRLDTATMLALVFLSEEPDARRANKAVKRVNELYETLISPSN